MVGQGVACSRRHLMVLLGMMMTAPEIGRASVAHRPRGQRAACRTTIAALMLTLVLCSPRVAAQPACGPPGLQQLAPVAWGFDLENTRLAKKSTISRGNIGRLTLKWVYGLATDQPRSMPLVSGDTMFVGDGGRGIVALDRESGCERWRAPLDSEVGSSISFAREAGGKEVRLVVAMRDEGIFALNARDGEAGWFSKPGDNPVPLYSGSPLVHNNVVYVPGSSLEIALSLNPFYGCCETSGGMSAISVEDGAVLWHRRTIPGLPKVTGRRLLFIETHGPSGAPVWGAPTLDRKRGLLFFGTGQNYSHPASATSDAIFALNTSDGSVAWLRQFTANDAYNLACNAGGPNCPDPVGPDIDFGAPPVLVTLPGSRDLLIAGQKSGDVHAMDPQTGDVVWQRKLGRGGALGGIHWGMAAHSQKGILVVPMSDLYAGDLTGVGDARPGVHALDLETGRTLWSHPASARCPDRVCWGGFSAAISLSPELVFAGTLDGMLHVLDLQTGELLWSHDSWRNFDAINGVPTSGGAFDAHGPLLVDDLLIVSSGYGSFSQRPGNALLVFQIGAGESADE
jgi:polyvinyl alcohol dehydrogenase (cytochrome)